MRKRYPNHPAFRSGIARRYKTGVLIRHFNRKAKEARERLVRQLEIQILEAL